MATAEKLPAYRMPHIPHRGRVIAGAILTVALAASARGIFDNSSSTPPQPGTGRISPEQMRYPLGKQLLNLSVDSSGKLLEEATTMRQVLQAESFNLGEGQNLTFREEITLPDILSRGADQPHPITLSAESLEDAYFVPVFGAVYGENKPKNLYGDVNIIMGSDILHGGVYLRLSDAEGDPIEGPNGVPIYTTPDQVNLPIPEQAQKPMTA